MLRKRTVKHNLRKKKKITLQEEHNADNFKANKKSLPSLKTALKMYIGRKKNDQHSRA